MSAVTTNRNTFKVKTVLVAPGAFLALVALEDTGVILVDTETKMILAEFNIIGENNPFIE